MPFQLADIPTTQRLAVCLVRATNTIIAVHPRSAALRLTPRSFAFEAKNHAFDPHIGLSLFRFAAIPCRPNVLGRRGTTMRRVQVSSQRD